MPEGLARRDHARRSEACGTVRPDLRRRTLHGRERVRRPFRAADPVVLRPGTWPSSRAQAEANASAGSLDVPPELDEGVRDIYDEYFRASVHPRW